MVQAPACEKNFPGAIIQGGGQSFFRGAIFWETIFLGTLFLGTIFQRAIFRVQNINKIIFLIRVEQLLKINNNKTYQFDNLNILKYHRTEKENEVTDLF